MAILLGKQTQTENFVQNGETFSIKLFTQKVAKKKNLTFEAKILISYSVS
jgi:hypothetical protein